MGRKITIEPVTRIEGHANVTIHLDDSGRVENAYLHVNQYRGFEKFSEGRLHFEMPESRSATSATARVVWKADGEESDHCGVGLRFLLLDRESAQHIEAYVNERIPTIRSPAFRLD